MSPRCRSRAQQHGMICLDDRTRVVRKALLWNDTRSSTAAADLVGELGGARGWADRVGVVPVASITAAKLRWLADTEPANADATALVCLPHDWLTWRLSGSADLADIRTDRSDASGTGYFAADGGGYQLMPLRILKVGVGASPSRKFSAQADSSPLGSPYCGVMN